MNQEKYEKLLEDLTVAVKSLDGNIYALKCEINHLRKVIEEAEKTAKTDFIGKNKIEKRS